MSLQCINNRGDSQGLCSHRLALLSDSSFVSLRCEGLVIPFDLNTLYPLISKPHKRCMWCKLSAFSM